MSLRGCPELRLAAVVDDILTGEFLLLAADSIHGFWCFVVKVFLDDGWCLVRFLFLKKCGAYASAICSCPDKQDGGLRMGRIHRKMQRGISWEKSRTLDLAKNSVS